MRVITMDLLATLFVVSVLIFALIEVVQEF